MARDAWERGYSYCVAVCVCASGWVTVPHTMHVFVTHQVAVAIHLEGALDSSQRRGLEAA